MVAAGGCALALALSLSGCGSAGSQDAGTDDAGQAADAPATQDGPAGEAKDPEYHAPAPAAEAATPTKDAPTPAGALRPPADGAPVSAAQLRGVISQHIGDYAVAYADAAGAWEVGVALDTPHVSASVIKLAVAGAFLERSAQGDFPLDAQVTIDAGDVVGGTGVVQNSGAGSTWTYRELVQHMISDSDNTATNVLIDAIGLPAVNDYATRNGLDNTKLNRKMMDFSTDEQNYTSAHDVAAMLRMIYGGTFVNADMSALMMDALKAQSDTSGIDEGLPDGLVFAHKTGTLDTVKNDAGIILDGHPRILVVLGQDVTEAGAQSCMTDLGKLVVWGDER